MLRASDFHQRTCGVSAGLCVACADSCQRVDPHDRTMSQCVEICRRCADSCRRMAGLTARPDGGTREPGACSRRCMDVLMRPLKALALRRWRDRAWGLLPRGGLGLEVGAGTGANFRFYPGQASVVALDRSWAMLSRAKRKEAGTLFVAADVRALPFRDDSFDWTVGTLVFCEVDSPGEGFREIWRVTKPGGRLVLLEHIRPSGWLWPPGRCVTAVSAPLFGEPHNRRTPSVLSASGWRIT